MTSRDMTGYNPSSEQELRQAVLGLSLAIPKVDELDATEQINMTVAELGNLTATIRRIEELVDKLHPKDSDQGVSISKVEGDKLDSCIIDQLSEKGVDTCEQLSELGVFDLINLSIYSTDIHQIKNFLKNRGYNYPGCELNQYDRAQFMKSNIKPTDELPLLEINSDTRSHNSAIKHLIYAGIQTYGELTSCTREDLLKIRLMGDTKVQFIEDFISSFGLKLKL